MAYMGLRAVIYLKSIASEPVWLFEARIFTYPLATLFRHKKYSY